MRSFKIVAIFLGLLLLVQAGSAQGVCARVKIKIEQEVVMTRSAFLATLELGNNQVAGELNNVGFDMQVFDSEGEQANERFNIRVTDLEGITGITGGGTLGPAGTATAEWTLVPRDTAAPLTNEVYAVGGDITFLSNGSRFTIPVEPVEITVRPDAALYLKYYHQRDVFSDDPHTDNIEPSIPYGLAVLVDNQGAGAARNLKITSAQPEIVDNEKGLLIDFKIIGTEVAGQALSPSLTADFGDLPAGEQKVATWLITSTLQGLFIRYNASFEHIDGLGDPKLSLIKDVEIFEMNHMIRALGDLDDGLPDFLVNAEADARDLPDEVHYSDGGIAPVTLVETGSADQVTADQLSVTLTAPMGAGWHYLRIPDPADGQLTLVSVTRSDGLEIPVPENAWVTDRTFVGQGRRPIYENILHLADFDSTGEYTLTYENIDPFVSFPPTSTIEALPIESSALIPVRWAPGTNGAVVTSYDIYVQINNGEWELWLENTTRTSALYDGEFDTVYAFRSVARDANGTMEVVTEEPDAVTRVSVANEPPVFSAISDQEIDEGQPYTYQLSASDPEGDNGALRFELVSTQPSGLTVEPETGLLRWTTGEEDGGSSNRITVSVNDGQTPPAAATTSFWLSVRELNAPPIIEIATDIEVPENSTFRLPFTVTDGDLPAQTLTVQPSTGSPADMHVIGNEVVWDVPGVNATTSLTFSVVAEDDGDPARTDTAIIRLTILDDGLPGLEFTGSLPDVELACGEFLPAPDVAGFTNGLINRCEMLNISTELLDRVFTCVGTRQTICYHAVNNCGDRLSVTQTFSYVDTEAPQVVTTNIMLGCDPDTIPDPVPPQAFDDCASVNDLDSTRLSSLIITNGAQRMRFDIYSIADTCDNAVLATQQVSWSVSGGSLDVADLPPVDWGCDPLIIPPGDLDAFPGLMLVSLSTNTTAPGTLSGCERERLLVYLLEDGCGNQAEARQTQTWREGAALAVDASAFPDTTLSCGVDVPPPDTNAFTAALSGNCGTEGIDLEVTPLAGLCDASLDVVYVYTASNICGDVVTVTQRFLHSEPSSIEYTGGIDLDIELDCAEAGGVIAPELAAFEAGLSSSCGGLVVTARTETIAANCTGLDGTRIIYSATDDCGATLTLTQDVQFVDTTAPTITAVAGTVSLGCNPLEIPVPEVPQAEDDCGTVATPQGGLASVSTRTNGQQRIRAWVYAFSDPCGNSTRVTQEVAWVVAEGDVELEPLPASDLGCAPNAVSDGAVMTAAALPEELGPAGGFELLAATTNETVGIANACRRSLDITYELQDDCGRIATVTKTVTWLDPNMSPLEIGETFPRLIEVVCGDEIPSPDEVAFISDLAAECGLSDGVDVQTMEQTGDVGDCPGQANLQRVFTVSNDCGQMLSVTQLIVMVVTNPPVSGIAVVGELPASGSIGCREVFPPADLDAFLAALESDCGPVTGQVSSAFSTDCLGGVTYVYQAGTSCGDELLVTQIFQRADNDPPDATVTNVMLGCNPDRLPDVRMPKSTDRCSADLTTTFEGSFTTTNGSLRVRAWVFEVTDPCGNSTMATQTMSWSVDTMPLELESPPDLLLACGGTPPDADPARVFPPGLMGTVLDSELSVNGCDRLRIDTYQAEDQCGNTAVVSQRVSWVETASAQFTGIPADVGPACGPFPIPEVFFADGCGNEGLAPEPEDSLVSGDECFQEFLRIWRIADACGGMVSATQRIMEVIDAPIIVLETLPPEVVLTCGTPLPEFDATPFLATLASTCMIAEMIIETNGIPGECEQSQNLQVRYIATSSCGRSVTGLQQIVFTPEAIALDLFASVYRADDDLAACPGGSEVEGLPGTPVEICLEIVNSEAVAMRDLQLEIPALGISTNLGGIARGTQLLFMVASTVSDADQLLDVFLSGTPVSDPGMRVEASQTVSLLSRVVDLNVVLEGPLDAGLLPGGGLTLTVRVDNVGSLPVGGIALLVTLPDGLFLDDPNWAMLRPGVIRYLGEVPPRMARVDIPTLLQPGQSVFVPLVLRVGDDQPPGPLTIRVDVDDVLDAAGMSVLDFDPTPEDLEDGIVAIIDMPPDVHQPQPGIELVGIRLNGQVPPDPALVNFGSVLNWELSIQNTGDVNLASFRVTELISSSNLLVLAGDNGDGMLATNEIWQLGLQEVAGEGEIVLRFFLEGQAGDQLFQRQFESRYTGLAGSIAGRLWWDDNFDRNADAEEPGASGITVELLDGSGSFFASMESGEDGRYRFDSLPPGSYQVQVPETQFDEYTELRTESPVNVAVAGGIEGPEIDFGLFRRSKIRGTVWKDFSNDDMSNENMDVAGIEGLTVFLFQIVDGQSEFLRTETTDEMGDFVFADPVPGTYDVMVFRRQVLPLNRQAVMPEVVTNRVFISQGDRVDVAFPIEQNTVDIQLASFTAEVLGDGVVISWETAQENDVLLFEIYRMDRNGNRSRVGGEAILAKGGGHYSILDAGSTGGHYVLVELGTNLEQQEYPATLAVLDAPPLGEPTTTKQAENDILEFTSQPGVRTYLASGFSSEPMAVDETNPDYPRELRGRILQPESGGEWGIYFSPARSGGAEVDIRVGIR